MERKKVVAAERWWWRISGPEAMEMQGIIEEPRMEHALGRMHEEVVCWWSAACPGLWRDEASADAVRLVERTWICPREPAQSFSSGEPEELPVRRGGVVM